VHDGYDPNIKSALRVLFHLARNPKHYLATISALETPLTKPNALLKRIDFKDLLYTIVTG
jgi:hypothetical protein